MLSFNKGRRAKVKVVGSARAKDPCQKKMVASSREALSYVSIYHSKQAILIFEMVLMLEALSLFCGWGFRNVA